MAGFNTKNLLTKDTALSSSIPTDWFKIHEGDLNGVIFQINAAADPGAVTLETSFDGGLTVKSYTLTALDAYGSGFLRLRLPDTYYTAYQKLGPLARIRPANAITATAIWKTIVS
jgi:hypothetical protein